MKKLFVILSMMLLTASAFAYDFSAVCESGQTLYYKVLSESEKTVELTYAEYYNAGHEQWFTYYYGVTAPSGDLVIPEKVQYNSEYYTVIKVGDHAFHACNLTSVVFPNTLISIGDSAFASDTYVSLRGELHLPDNLQTIGYRAFEWNTALTAVYIPNSVRSVGQWCFYDCVGLKYLYLGSGLEDISFEAFSNCHSLDSITIDRVTPPICQYSSFRYVPKGIPVYVPCNTLDLYQNAEFWNEFTNFIEDCTLSANEYFMDGVTVTLYPNPANNILIVETRHGTSLPNQTYRITNIMGQTLLQGSINAEIQQINIASLPAGLYFLSVGNTTQKFVKQ